MPQVDLETFVCGVDRKIACESVIDDHHLPSDKPDHAEAQPDFPAESIQLHKVEELDWFDRNAFYERKESQKGNSNPNHNSTSNSTSQRFSLNFTSNTSILGLPNPKQSCFIVSKSRRSGPPPRAWFFPKRPSRSGKLITVTEPSSPKVSCMGRVRSKRDKSRRRRRCARGRQPTETATATATTTATTTTTAKTCNSETEKKTGFWANLMGILGCSCRNGPSGNIEEPPKDAPSLASLPRWSFAERAPKSKIPASAPLGEPTGLDSIKRFSSGRRSETWANGIDLDFEDSVVVDSDAPDRRPNIWRRRDVDPAKKIDCVRDWESVGPASL